MFSALCPVTGQSGLTSQSCSDNQADNIELRLVTPKHALSVLHTCRQTAGTRVQLVTLQLKTLHNVWAGMFQNRFVHHVDNYY